MKRKIWIGILLISFGILVYQFTFKLKVSALVDQDLISFDESMFVDAMTLSDPNKLVGSNSDFELYLDETTSYFKVIDKRSNEVWASNPSIPDPMASDPGASITNTAIEKQKATLEVQYVNDKGSLTLVNNYKLSISHPESMLAEAGERTYKIRYIDNGFQVLYNLEDLEVDYLFFPKYVEKDVFEALEQFDYLKTLAYTGYDEVKELYFIPDYEGISGNVIKRLYPIFYDELGYTRERAIEENAQYGYIEEYDKVKFQIGVEVTLTNQGVKTAIIRDSIAEQGEFRISSISLYPLFGTAINQKDNAETEGYIVLPDGSGAIIEFNNGKFYQNPYRKHLYGQDLALLPYKMREEQQDITLPLYGMVKDTAGYAAIITKGDAMATISADVSGRIDSYNKAFTTFDLRESESITLGSGFNAYGLTLWTRPIVKTDFEVSYTFLNGSDNSYVGIANTYRDYLINTLGMTPKDQTTKTVLTTEFLGAYDKKEFFLGVPYHTTRSLTTFKQAEKIINLLQSEGLDNLNVIYTGVSNGGLSSSIETKYKVEKALGGESGLNRFTDHMSALGIDVYPSINVATASSYRRFSDQYTYTSKRLNNDQSRLFDYHIPSGLPYSETTYMHSGSDFIINPVYYQAIYNKLIKDFNSDKFALPYIGAQLAGSYDRSGIVYRQDALFLQQALLENAEETFAMKNPMGFAMPYANYITDLPTETTLYSIIDDQIPLVQLVLSGLVDYASDAINLSSTRSTQYNFLKTIETGSNLKYTLTHDDSRELLNTEYNMYMSTYYMNWVDVMRSQVTEIDALNIHEGRLVNHERIANNVYVVTYSNGVEIALNYNLSSYNYLGQTIQPMDYLVLGGM